MPLGEWLQWQKLLRQSGKSESVAIRYIARLAALESEAESEAGEPK